MLMASEHTTLSPSPEPTTLPSKHPEPIRDSQGAVSPLLPERSTSAAAPEAAPSTGIPAGQADLVPPSNSGGEIAAPTPHALARTTKRVVRINENDLSQHLQRLRSVIQRFVAADDVEDVLQEVMVAALSKLSTFRGEAAVGTWLHRIAINAALAHRRRRAEVAKREERWQDEEPDRYQPAQRPRRTGTVTPDQESERRELSGLLQDAIAKLPPKYHEVYVLADLENWSNEAIARKLNLKVPAVKSRLFRARKMIRDQLAPHFDWDATSPGENDTRRHSPANSE